MLLYLFLLFTILPILEIWVLLQIGHVIHVGPTIGLILFTGVVGAALARREGLRTLSRIRENLSQGVMPTSELVDGMLIFLAGALLVTPGVITDAFGFLLLIPFLRRWFRRQLSDYFKRRIVVVGPAGSPFEHEVIDVEARDVTDQPADTKRDYGHLED